MTDPKDMTKFQRIVTGLKIFEEYLSPRDNPGDISAEHDTIYVTGVDRKALGGDDLKKLKAMDWTWNTTYRAWEFML